MDFFSRRSCLGFRERTFFLIEDCSWNLDGNGRAPRYVFPRFRKAVNLPLWTRMNSHVDTAHRIHECIYACIHVCIYVPSRTTHYLITHNARNRRCIPMRWTFLSNDSESFFHFTKTWLQLDRQKNVVRFAIYRVWIFINQ